MIKHVVRIAAAVSIAALAGPVMAQSQPSPPAQPAPRNPNMEAARVMPREMSHPRNSGTICVPGYSVDPLVCQSSFGAKMKYVIGQTVPIDPARLLAYQKLPFNTRIEYGNKLNKANRYFVDSNYAYAIDPETMTVTQIAQLVKPEYTHR